MQILPISIWQNSAIREIEDENEIDETGINPADLLIVMEQANASRAAAVRAMRQHNNDIVEAIMV